MDIALARKRADVCSVLCEAQPSFVEVRSEARAPSVASRAAFGQGGCAAALLKLAVETNSLSLIASLKRSRTAFTSVTVDVRPQRCPQARVSRKARCAGQRQQLGPHAVSVRGLQFQRPRAHASVVAGSVKRQYGNWRCRRRRHARLQPHGRDGTDCSCGPSAQSSIGVSRGTAPAHAHCGGSEHSSVRCRRLLSRRGALSRS
jgi:hypothetical protein